MDKKSFLIGFAVAVLLTVSYAYAQNQNILIGRVGGLSQEQIDIAINDLNYDNDLQPILSQLHSANFRCMRNKDINSLQNIADVALSLCPLSEHNEVSEKSITSDSLP